VEVHDKQDQANAAEGRDAGEGGSRRPVGQPADRPVERLRENGLDAKRQNGNGEDQGSARFLIEMAERTQIQLQAVTHMFFSQAVPVQRSRSARLRLENARRSYRSSFCNVGRT
jgi:hypothetical protein